MCLIEPSYGHTGRFGIAIWMSPEMAHEGAPHAIDIRQIALKTLFVEEGMLHGEFRMHTNTSNLRSTVLAGLGGWFLLDLAFLEYDLDHIRTGVPSGTFPMPSGMCARAQGPRGPVPVTPCAERLWQREVVYLFIVEAFTTTAEREMACDVKETWCYMALDCNTEWKSTAEFSQLCGKVKTYEFRMASSSAWWSLFWRLSCGGAEQVAHVEGLHLSC